jgi:ABC-type dipeptide/oligopeptide/nickel transport system permease component
MKDHKYLLYISCALLIVEVVFFILILNKGYLKNGYKIFLALIIIIWILSYPIGFYTCYRHIGNADRKSSIIANIIGGSNDDILLSFILIPLFLSPFLIFDYCSILKEDIRKYKWENNSRKREDNIK